MFGAMTDADAVEETNGTLKVTRNGQSLMLHRPRGKDMADKKELMQVRHFLERSGAPAPAPAKVGTHLLVVIDHREARIYSTELHGSVAQRITPYDPAFEEQMRFAREGMGRYRNTLRELAK